MSDALTPERRATLRSRAEAMLGGEYNRVVHVPAQTLLTLLDAADEVAKLREEVESHREARQMLADDLIALGKGNPGKLELSYGVEQRIAALETENATLRAENADLDHDLSDHDALFNRNCALNERVAELECDAAELRYAAESQLAAMRTERDELREQVEKLRAAVDDNIVCNCGIGARRCNRCRVLAATAPKEPAK